jgi:ABC-2 type transport system ATP-binding protein
VRVLGDPQLAGHLLRDAPGVVEIAVVAGVVHVGYQGSDAKIAEIVAQLVRGGVGVIGVEPERNELERIFLEVTRGDMA